MTLITLSMGSSLINQSNIMFVLGILAIMFSVYNYFRNPQIASDKNSALADEAVRQLQKDFAQFSAQFQAHLSADQASFQLLNTHIVEVDKSVVRLTTIIDERIPKG